MAERGQNNKKDAMSADLEFIENKFMFMFKQHLFYMYFRIGSKMNI